MGLRVLVLDDVDFVRKSFAKVLTRAGHEVVEASTVKEAAQKLGDTSPPFEVIVLDREVHGEIGWDLAEKAPPTCRVVKMSGDTVPNVDYFVKGRDPKELLARVAGLR